MKNIHFLRLAVVMLLVVSLFATSNTAYAAYGVANRWSITSIWDNAINSIASRFGFSSSDRTSQTTGGYRYNSRHGGINAQYKSADGKLLTIDYCNNGAQVATILTPCTSDANVCGMTGSGFITQIISGERQVRSSTSACSAQRPSDSLCSSTQSQTTTCVPANICSSDGNVINSCTGALVQTCPSGCADGRCLNTCTPHYFCQGDTLYWGDTTYSFCSASVSQVCTWGCSNGACNLPPSASFGEFTFTTDTNGTQVATDGSLTARPPLVQRGNTSRLYWNVLHIQPNSCKVVGSNGDSFDGTDSGTGSNTANSSGATGVETSAIQGQTSYTLTCTGIDNTPFSDSTTVNILPTYEEL